MSETETTTVANSELEHTDSGRTTRDDALDAGVPMTPGDPAEPQGPEDALGRGLKRGDYTDRVPGNPHTSVPTENGGQPIYRNAKTGKDAKAGDKDAVIVDYAPTAELVAQAPLTEQVGDVPGLKGGVETDPLSDVGRGFAAGQAAAAAADDKS